jgi:hypothetical protein
MALITSQLPRFDAGDVEADSEAGSCVAMRVH